MIETRPRPRWRRRLSVLTRRARLFSLLEIAATVALVVMLAVTYFIVTDQRPQAFVTPAVVAALLVAILVPAMALMVLLARRLAMRRAARSSIGSRGKLHVRLVAIFSAIAAVPTLLVVIFASLLFQSGLQFWFSDDAETILRNAENTARVYRDEHMARIGQDADAMGTDIVGEINEVGLEGQTFTDYVLIQKIYRTLSEAAVISVTPANVLQTHVAVDLDQRPMEQRVSAAALRQLRAGEAIVATDVGDRVEAVIRLDPEAEIYLYVSRYLNPEALRLIREAGRAAGDYRETLNRSRNLQLRFNAILLGVSLLIVALSIWIALTLADRLVRPVGNLLDAARKVTAGDLTARVPTSKVNDEVGTLGNAFNRMTRRLEEQTGALVAANDQLDTRRAFMEAVLSGVTAGVISVDDAHVIRLINSSAESLLRTATESPVGKKLADLAPELDRQLDAHEREEIIQLALRGETRTLAVKTVKVEGGHVLTFDDITDQLIDQRRAAWSDVARRIAHEIKNPLTPIQLAAERLQRRYGAEITSDAATFERLTGTIVRQVGDLRRMVDEFSSFARMPKPVFREEAVVEVARQALFLHEVAHPEVAFSFDAPDPSPMLVCDRRLLGQALTNVVKNAVEAIEQKKEERGGEGTPLAADPEKIVLRIAEEGGELSIEVLDTGIGLPADRRNLTEPYMTTRAKGTGLGLAIVKKIIEEHFGRIEFADVPGGGTRVRIVFDAGALERLGAGGALRHPEEHTANG
ncbi:MAG TPA: PAS domain-containing sensor histidine kinase [Allosphingosinicella sp.]|nr:PAS domain-containing sensor histidine kinase [Allosphingosinicella sp.]